MIDESRCLVLRTTCALLCGLWPLFSAEAVSADSNPDPMTRRPGVAAANARLTAGYAFSHVDSTSADFFSAGTGTTSVLRIDDTDAHTVGAEIIGTIPLTHSIGARGKFRGSYGGMRQSVDLLEPGNDDFDSASYGATAEIFVRDPDLGSLTLGSRFDRLDGDGGSDANEFGATAGAAAFFPDMGAGPVDWFLGFEYAYREVSGSRTMDLDLYKVGGGAGWYVTDDFQFRVGGRWSRAENGTVSEEDSEGFMDYRWLLPLPVSVELSMGGSVGVSEYKESPFPSDDRLIYGAKMALTFRFGSAPTLIESVRAYD